MVSSQIKVEFDLGCLSFCNLTTFKFIIQHFERSIKHVDFYTQNCVKRSNQLLEPFFVFLFVDEF